MERRGIGRQWRMLIGLGLGLAGFALVPAWAHAGDIGSATKAFNIVQGTAPGSHIAQLIVPGQSVGLGEEVDTAAKSAATFLFQDDTELSLGAGSSARFDRFTFNAKTGVSSLALTLSRGVFRFATGAVDRTAYVIHTPLATIGGRGGVFDVQVAADGATTVTVDDGEAAVAVGSGSAGTGAAGAGALVLHQGFTSVIRPGAKATAPYRTAVIAPEIMAMNMLLTESDPVLPGVSAADRVAADSHRSLTTVSGLRVPPSRVAALAGSLNGTSDGLRALQAWMDAAGGAPEGVAARAIDLIDALKTGSYASSVDAVGAAGDRISKAAQASLNASYILRAGVARQVVLTGDRQGFLFGPKDTPKLARFTLVAPGSSHIAGPNITAFLRKGAPPLMGNGLSGVVNFSTSLPDGHYRLILWTNSSGGARDQWLPFGQNVVINGTPYRIAAAAASRWPGNAVLGGRKVTSKFSGGVALITADISGGILNINFGAESTTYLSALIIEQADEPSLLHATGAAAGVLEGHDLMSPKRLNAMAAVDAALGDLLTRFIITADPQAPSASEPAPGSPPRPPSGAGPAHSG